jgi:hypothetical protein
MVMVLATTILRWRIDARRVSPIVDGLRIQQTCNVETTDSFAKFAL